MSANLDREKIARKIFEEIRDRPYRVALYPDAADNCFYKGTEVIQKLTSCGYEMRARVGEFYWEDTPCPKEIVDLHPENEAALHFYPEIYHDGAWKILDPSFNRVFSEKTGLPYSEFGEENEPCFPMEKLYNAAQQAEYTWKWVSNPQMMDNYMAENHDFLYALNLWLEEINPCP
jgi:hypothetical protein